MKKGFKYVFVLALACIFGISNVDAAGIKRFNIDGKGVTSSDTITFDYEGKYESASKKYLAVYDKNDPETKIKADMEGYELIYLSELQLENLPDNDNYYFLGWYNADSKGNPVGDTPINYYHEITKDTSNVRRIAAKWQKKDPNSASSTPRDGNRWFKITYDNDASITDANGERVKELQGDFAVNRALPIPKPIGTTNKGYIFSGWLLNGTSNIYVKDEVTISSSNTIEGSTNLTLVLKSTWTEPARYYANYFTGKRFTNDTSGIVIDSVMGVLSGNTMTFTGNVKATGVNDSGKVVFNYDPQTNIISLSEKVNKTDADKILDTYLTSYMLIDQVELSNLVYDDMNCIYLIYFGNLDDNGVQFKLDQDGYVDAFQIKTTGVKYYSGSVGDIGDIGDIDNPFIPDSPSNPSSGGSSGGNNIVYGEDKNSGNPGTGRMDYIGLVFVITVGAITLVKIISQKRKFKYSK